MVTPTAIMLLEPEPAALPPPSPPPPTSEPELPPLVSGLAAIIGGPLSGVAGSVGSVGSVASSVGTSSGGVVSGTVSSTGSSAGVLSSVVGSSVNSVTGSVVSSVGSSDTVGGCVSSAGAWVSSISAANAVTAPRGKQETAITRTNRRAKVFFSAFKMIFLLFGK